MMCLGRSISSSGSWTGKGEALLDARVYNSLLAAYLTCIVKEDRRGPVVGGSMGAVQYDGERARQGPGDNGRIYRAFTTSEEASEVIQALLMAAVEMGLSKAVNKLSMAESLGREHVDPLEEVPHPSVQWVSTKS
ncbi:hypothetical protein AcV5_010106 [Taiwanofungus camphoratus]|nr:hypothetical protein AcV5_010106 [Antrodia cinnamomea]